jgi:hypothetical protein
MKKRNLFSQLNLAEEKRSDSEYNYNGKYVFPFELYQTTHPTKILLPQKR